MISSQFHTLYRAHFPVLNLCAISRFLRVFMSTTSGTSSFSLGECVCVCPCSYSLFFQVEFRVLVWRFFLFSFGNNSFFCAFLGWKYFTQGWKGRKQPFWLPVRLEQGLRRECQCVISHTHTHKHPLTHISSSLHDARSYKAGGSTRQVAVSS